MQRLLIVGAGGHGRSVAEVVMANGSLDVAGFIDDAASRLDRVFGLPVLGPIAALQSYRDRAEAAIVAIGNNRMREDLQGRLRAAGFELATAVHSRAIISPSAVIGAGCAIMAGAIVGAEAVLGDGVIVNSGAVVDHHCRVEDFGHLGTNASMAGGAVLGRGAWMQAGSAIGYAVHVAPGDILEPGQGRAAKA
jgi:sugar O-acyltransferase (sialic acid O-acetyltransferase NeuD family)